MDIREQEIEQRLRTAMDHAAPDPLDRILASCTEQKGTVIPMTEFKKPRRRWAPLAVAAALAAKKVQRFLLDHAEVTSVTDSAEKE